MSTYGFKRVKKFQYELMTAWALPELKELMGVFFPIWYDLLRRIVHVMKKFSKESYSTNPDCYCSWRSHCMAIHLFTEFFPRNDGYNVSCRHLGLRHHEFESYELIVGAFMHMMRAVPSEFVNEICYFIQNTLFEPSFERFWKIGRSKDREMAFDPRWIMDPLTFDKKYAAINALESFHVFITRNLYPVPKKILCAKLIWRGDNYYFIEFRSRQHFSNSITITFQKRLKMLWMHGMFNKLVLRLFFKRGIFPISSQLEQMYIKKFGEVIYELCCRKMKVPKEVPILKLPKITASHFRELCKLAKISSFKRTDSS